jgi:hypothetical protein
MKNFNQVISVQVSVNSIANQLLDSMSADFKHRELVTESIIGRMLNDGSLSYLYNSLNGYPTTIDFKIGDEVGSVDGLRTYGYWTEESVEKNNSCLGYVKNGTVIEINEYSDKKIKIQFQTPNNKGGFDTSSQWVNHLDWNKMTTEPVLL